MVAAVVVGMWAVVLVPLAVVFLLDRPRSSLASFEATIRGFERSSSAAVGIPVRSRPSARRRHLVLVALAVPVALTLSGVALSPSRTTLAAQSASDQVLVAYLAAIVARKRAPARPQAGTGRLRASGVSSGGDVGARAA